MESKLSEMMQSAMNSVKRLVEVNNIIGEPINTADGLTLVLNRSATSTPTGRPPT